MAHFSCPRCYITQEKLYCPKCNQFLTEDIDLIESIMKPPKAAGPIAWATAFGHWGDVFCCCGVIQALMRQTGQEKVNVLYVGEDIDVVEWLKAQTFVGKVLGVKKADKGYERFWGATTRPGTTPKDWLKCLDADFPHCAIPKADAYTQTHINSEWFQTKGGMPAQLWSGARLPTEAHRWAQEALSRLLPIRTGPVIHLHPVSTASELAGNHWQHWLAAIEWLVEKTPHTYLLTGLEKIAYLPQSPRLINLIGRTKSNLHVLALSEYCDGVICTPNSLAHWSVIRGQRALVVGNKATEFLTSYYRRFIERGERTVYVNVDTPFSKFQAAACAFLEGDAPAV